jgi:transcription antitermination protein NusB
MLSRRFLRIKTMQALYSYFKNEKPDMSVFEKELFKSIDQVYDLYLVILNIFSGIHQNELLIIDENKNKRLPSKEDLNPDRKLLSNSLLVSIAESSELKTLIEKRKLDTVIENDIVRRIITEIKKSEEFISYTKLEAPGIKEDKQLLSLVVIKVLNENDVLNSIFEEKNIYWTDDLYVAYNLVLKNFELFDGKFRVMPLLKDEKDDKEFVKILFEKTIIYKESNIELIQKHVKNWELDRIAEMDMLLMQMCITEFAYLPNVPVKASLNEYIDISKDYSTPNSKVFINGILDKIIFQLKDENRIQKQGRGLKES